MSRLFDGHGSYAEHTVIDEAIVARKPACLSHEEAASLPVAGGTAWECLVVRGGIRVGESVLVHAAAGGVGSLRGPDRSGGRRQGDRDLLDPERGVREGSRRRPVVDYTTEDSVEAALDATGGRGVDLVLDTIGGNAIARAGEALRPGGRLVSIVDIATPQNLLPLLG